MDETDRPNESGSLPRVAADAQVATNQLDPKFLEALEVVLREDDELLRRLAL